MLTTKTAANHIREALAALGYDVESDHMADTPRRVAEVWLQFAPHPDATFDFTTFDDKTVNQIVLARNIQVAGLCPHHLLPWRGRAHVAYLPNKKIAGISKLVRTAQWASRRAEVQEAVGNIIANHLEAKLEPMGIGVVIEALHDCVACRGAQDDGIIFITSVMRGIFFNNPVTRGELISLIGAGH
ncbi:hypothetical protein LCGC14_0446420 [marine sediment metagenome]|uniref:GTP cyclohydrolase I n=1 Tax=marine sediment metagenome TaxID=412755 RepID=A0A0F9T2B2_9ZZZZ